jgi:hypothetical protein
MQQWTAEVDRLLADGDELLQELGDLRDRLRDLRDLPKRRAREAREKRLVREKRFLDLPTPDEAHAELVGAVVQANEEHAEEQETIRRALESNWDFAYDSPGTSTRDFPMPKRPEEIPLSEVRAALERGYRLIASISRDGSASGGQLDAIRVGVIDDVEQSALRKALAFERVAVEREAWSAFLAHRLTAEERQLLGLVVRSGHAVALAASIMRLSEPRAERVLTAAYGKVRFFIFDSDV